MARTSVLGCVYASFFVLFGCFTCGTEPPQAGAAAPMAVPAHGADGPCGTDAALNSNNACVPTVWHCGPRYYNAGPSDGCDCDCGVEDPDCAYNSVQHWCYNVGRPTKVDACSACVAHESTSLTF